MLYRLSILIALSFSLSTLAQNHIDALRYSQESLWGSARYVSMGGAFGALGADGSSASSNPAGIATFTTGQFSASININEARTDGSESKSSFGQKQSFAKKNSATIPNLNYISANIFPPEIGADWDRLNFGIGYNKLADYNNRIYLEGSNSSNSLSTYILQNSQGKTYDELDILGQLAYMTYLTDTVGNEITYNSPLDSLLNRTQTYKSNSSGGKNEFYLSFGTAYQNKLFIGMTLGFPSIEYREKNTISETGFDSTIDPESALESFDYTSNLNVEGSGINLKLGLIYKIDDAIRYGFALHTPTYYEIHEEYSSSMNTTFLSDSTYSSETYLGLFDYGLSTPLKIINSLSFVIKKRAIISLEHEYLDYSNANLNSDFYSFENENNEINTVYASTQNIKLGTEIRVHPQLSLRAGYAYFGSPFTDKYNLASTEFLNFGLGIKVNQYTFDLALVNSYSQNEMSIYPNSEEVTIRNYGNQFLISGGFKF